MLSATVWASASLAAPLTAISTRRVAPSPSRAICFASETQAPVSAAVNAAASSASGGAATAPEASSSTVSLVLMSPSTLTRLKLRPTAERSAVSRAAGVSAASVVSTASMVAMWGWIIPAPLANPRIATGRPPSARSALAVLGRVSVVRMAREAAAAPRSEAAEVRDGR